MKTTTEVFDRLIKLHRIENLRHVLIEKILRVQSDLYTFDTPFGRDLNDIVDTVANLNQEMGNCTSCHHTPAIADRLQDLHSITHDYQTHLSFFITSSTNTARIKDLQHKADFLGNLLLTKTEQMSFEANENISLATNSAQKEIRRAKLLLVATLVMAFFAGVIVALLLMRSVTRPITDLVGATRAIAGGELGFTVSRSYGGEFGELTSNLNSMSLSLKNSYEKLKLEVVERQNAETAMRNSEERYALAARGANDGLWDWDINSDVMYFSPRWMSMLGYSAYEIGNKSIDWISLIHPDDRRQIEAHLNAHLDGTTENFRDEHRVAHKDGSYRWMLTRGIALRDSEGKAYRMAGSQTDITDRKLAEERLFHDAFHDGLTKLPNRALLVNRLLHAIEGAQRSPGHAFALLFLDLDRFKLINDSFGHPFGDQLLIGVAERLNRFVRPGDTVARFGGDEFAILLDPVSDASDALRIAKRIQEELPLPFIIAEQEVFTNASIGIALNAQHYKHPDQMLRDVDIALYQAKANGKARYELFDTSMHTSSILKMRTETDLRLGIERGELRLHYQPIFSLHANAIVGFEALVRWQHPQRGLLSPDVFIPIAEESGLITVIGNWVLQEACTKLGQQQNIPMGQSPMTLNVNLSSRDFTQKLVTRVSQILHDTKISPSGLRLEITESMLMGDAASVESLLWQLKNLGVGLQIDDFGTGYSSLSYLQRFPIDALKIDRSFVSALLTDKGNIEIVRAILDLARGLEIEVVAEGVESLDELIILKNMGCKYIQGHFIAKAAHRDTLAPWPVARLH